MWAMSYQRGCRMPSGHLDNAVGSTVTNEHPVLAIRRWNEMYHRTTPADMPRPVCVLLWYARLDDAEVAGLRAAGLDLTAQDVEIASA